MDPLRIAGRAACESGALCSAGKRISSPASDVSGLTWLVSGWARRAAFLWAVLPVAAVLIIEKLVFNTAVFARMLLSRLAGGPAAIPFPMRGGMPMQAPTLANLGAFLASPGLWVGLVILAAFLAAAVRLRRYQGPI